MENKLDTSTTTGKNIGRDGPCSFTTNNEYILNLKAYEAYLTNPSKIPFPEDFYTKKVDLISIKSMAAAPAPAPTWTYPVAFVPLLTTNDIIVKNLILSQLDREFSFVSVYEYNQEEFTLKRFKFPFLSVEISIV